MGSFKGGVRVVWRVPRAGLVAVGIVHQCHVQGYEQPVSKRWKQHALVPDVQWNWAQLNAKRRENVHQCEGHGNRCYDHVNRW